MTESMMGLVARLVPDIIFPPSSSTLRRGKYIILISTRLVNMTHFWIPKDRTWRERIWTLKVPLWSKKSLPFFLGILKVCLLNTWLAKFWPLIFIQNLFTLRVNFGFRDPPLLTFKPDRLDLRGLDPGKVTSKAHQLKISACERSLLNMQSASLKVWKPKTPVLHINSVAYTRIAFLN